MIEPLINLQGISRTYRNGELSTTVLHDIDLRINQGEFVAIMGASGSGKSTLMHLLGCLDRPTTGRYLLRGQDVASLGRDDLARQRRETFGFIFQSYHLIASASATENVEVPAIYAGLQRVERRERAESLLTGLGETDTALGAVAQARQRYRFVALATAEADKAFDLAEIRYRAGSTDLQSLLDTQRT